MLIIAFALDTYFILIRKKKSTSFISLRDFVIKKTLMCFLLITAQAVIAQSPLQPYLQRQARNPAFTGLTTEQFSSYYLSEWSKIPGSYFETGFMFSGQINTHGYGMNLRYSQSGTASINEISVVPTYAYSLSINESLRASLGAGFGVHQFSLDPNQLVFADQLSLGNNLLTESGEDISNVQRFSQYSIPLGGLLFNEKWWTGLSYQLYLNQESFFGSPDSDFNRINISFGFRELLKNSEDEGSIILLPEFHALLSGVSTQIKLGSNLVFDQFKGQNGKFFSSLYYQYLINTGIRRLFVSLGLQQERFTFAYSYGYSLSSIANLGGSHEFGISFALQENKTVKPFFN